MMHSLLSDFERADSCRWAFADYDSAEINGDSADPILADAYAFGVHNFDAREALRAMVRGANTVGTGVGWDVARQDNDQYLARGWVQVDRRDKTSFDYTIGGSETLEYAIDDAAIAKLAAALGAHDTAATFTARAGNWHHLFNPATGYLAARRADGSFPPGPAFQRSPLAGIGQDGWEEGNAFNTRGACRRTCAASSTRWEETTRWSPSSTTSSRSSTRAGSSPSLGPGTSLHSAHLGSTTSRAPWRTQDVVRRIATGLYSATPNGEPGNDDLGAMSSWYVWAAIGMYPETPGSANLALASPLFTHVVITLPNGRHLSIDAPDASDAESLRANAACQRRAHAIRLRRTQMALPVAPRIRHCFGRDFASIGRPAESSLGSGPQSPRRRSRSPTDEQPDRASPPSV
jgi:putative alpha-1,2-mannosidase